MAGAFPKRIGLFLDMSPYQVHADSIAALMGALGADCPQITWNNQQFNIQPGSAILRKDLGIGGFQANADFMFTALIAQFPAPYNTPQTIKDALLQDRIDYLGDQYKVESVSILPGGLQIHVEANSLNQRA